MEKNHWEMLQENIHKIASILTEKGYDGMFQTAAGYSDKVENSINRYAYASVMGDEPGFKNGLYLRSYLQYEQDGDNIQVNFRISPGYQNHLEIKEVEIQKWDSRVGKFINVNLTAISIQSIPSKEEAIKMVNPQLNLKKQPKFRL